MGRKEVLNELLILKGNERTAGYNTRSATREAWFQILSFVSLNSHGYGKTVNASSFPKAASIVNLKSKFMKRQLNEKVKTIKLSIINHIDF